MKKMYVLALMSFCLLGANAQYFEWAKKGGLWQYDYGYGITTDNLGRVYVAGKYEQNANFSGTILPCQGNHDIFLAQYSPSGNLNWIRTAGGYTGDYATCVATDGANYVYIGGEIEGQNATIKFPGSSITLKCEGSNDIMLAKYTLGGQLLWARRAGGPYYEKALGITLDKYGNVYACGLFNKYAKFGGSTTVYGRGDNDIWIAKYDANGNFLWVRTAGSTSRDEAKGIACDPAGNVYITGLYRDGCKFGDKYLSSPNGAFNCFVAKYSPSGSLIWVKSGGGTWNDVGWGITVQNNLLYVGGEFNATATFGGKSIYTSGSSDVLVACYDFNGNVLWLKKAGGKLEDRARGIGSRNGKIYLTGQYGKTATFGSFSKTAADSSDIFIACMSGSGNFEWVMTAGGAADKYEDLGYESGNAVCADAGGNVYATGSMLDGATFGSTSLSRYSRTDVFVTKVKTFAALMPDDGGLPEPEPEKSAQLDSAAKPHFADEKVFNPSKPPVGPVKVEDGVKVLSDDALLVFPNPTAGTFKVALPSGKPVETEMQIFNNAGQLIETRKIIAPAEVTLDLSAQEKGIYFIVVRSKDAIVKRKLVIQ